MVTAASTQTRTGVLVNSFVRSVYNWMAVGLGLTGFVAYYVANSPGLQAALVQNPLMLIVLIVAQLGLVFAISGAINRLSAGAATGLFVLYAGLNGVILSFVFLAYTQTSIVSTFFICAGTFVGCSIYGWTTKRDLTSFGGFLMMGLIGIIIASLVNLFIRSSGMSLIISYIGVFVFVGLTAWDTQKLKNMALAQPADLEAGVLRKGAILGALSLYLDFINLFLMLLRIFGQTRD
ncbi:Bax inhibitor-1/YccA family protein [Desulfatiglans anilini]|uniref:Bax inhibitor-1/YccA family protein n=1 Tax=Desulfatiglans anilini TaxID=90728 RepID=UPI0003FA0C1B|nr:Bax inhibitor-1/YccA family protein [Desulfatiglans anilini]